MRLLLVCGFLLVGLPNLIGFAFAACVRGALLFARPYANPKVLTALGDVLGGVATVFAATIIARLLDLRFAPWLPIIAALWFAIHFTLLHRLPQFVRASIGVLCGWWAYSIFLN
jgi:hypothetical protein